MSDTTTLPSAEVLSQRLSASYEPYRKTRKDSVLLALALVKVLCTDGAPTATKVICDISDQGGDSLVLSWLEDAAGEELEISDELTDRLSDVLNDICDYDVVNEGSRRRPQPVIDLTSEFLLPETSKRDHSEFNTFDKVMGLLRDPDVVGTSAYRAVHECVSDALAGCSEGEDVLFQAIAEVVSIQDEAASVLRILQGEDL